MTIGTMILLFSAPSSGRWHRSERQLRGCGVAFCLRVSLMSSQTADSSPSRWLEIEQSGKRTLVAEGHRLAEHLGLGYRVVEPGLAPPLDEVQSKLGGEGRGDGRGLRVERERRAAGRDRFEQVFRGEVESREFFGGEHPDRESRRGDRALHEHAVEFLLHHPAESANDEDAEHRREDGDREGVELRGRKVAAVRWVSMMIAATKAMPSTPAAARTSRPARTVTTIMSPNPTDTDAVAYAPMLCSGQMATKSSATAPASATR